MFSSVRGIQRKPNLLSRLQMVGVSQFRIELLDLRQDGFVVAPQSRYTEVAQRVFGLHHINEKIQRILMRDGLRQLTRLLAGSGICYALYGLGLGTGDC